jgi:RND family efflux transporter MFP subunit
VQIDPIRVVFSQTDREYLALRRRELAGDAAALEARVLLPDGSVFPNIGKKDFDDNAINPATGTIAVRYLFDNPDGLLLPGGYVTVRLSNPAGETGIKIPQRALLIDQDGSYVLIVDEAGVVGILRVEAGDQVGPEVIILSGLKPGDRVVTDGVQKAMPGATVQVME